jgi:hypothetical protein
MLQRTQTRKRGVGLRIATIRLWPPSVRRNPRNGSGRRFVLGPSRAGKYAPRASKRPLMFKVSMLIAAGAAVLATSPADAQYYRYYGHHYRHHRHYRHYRHYSYYSYYSPYSYYGYSYPAYSYAYPAYYGYPMYYSYPAYAYPTFGISIGFGGGYRHYRRWR